ncbi:hypothetical protein [Phorcysia thermohydrogeniphila]|uniref:PilZ domain-containing protein n=1 Tax=Phorcysia thermohydrogeniphila TaxID=936138 RepID=A0A4V2PD69_9BACT|nr:hypothetical protein [Phorcysia thermohydrogeniphila]TCK03996.1 hypothetical protein CLV27_1313 [Phorcysia thermohydrogeniphila]
MERQKRYEGICYFRRFCNSRLLPHINIPLFFSFRVVKVDGSALYADRFSPPGIVELLLDKEAFLTKNVLDNGKVVLVKSLIEKKIDSSTVLLRLGEEVCENRRLFDRYVFCPEKLGAFELSSENAPLGKAYIVNVSLSGVEFVSPSADTCTILPGLILNASQGNKRLRVKVLRVKTEPGKVFIAGEILNTTFNLMDFIIDNYVKLVGEILLKNF